MKKRLTIGFLIDFFTDDYQAEILKGIVQETERQDQNLACFCGGPLESPRSHHHPRNAVFDLVHKNNVDGLILLGATIGNFVDIEVLQNFYKRYAAFPLVSLGIDIRIDGIPKILIDNATGMRSTIEHLISSHGCRRIAFIRGTEDNIESKIRYYAYKEVLMQYNIPFDSQLICPGDFYFGSGERAVSLLLDERKIHFDALVGSNDIMALEAMRELHKRGIQIPHEVAVVGFDDIEECRYISPPLTTVRQPLFLIGQESVRTVLKLIQGEEVDSVQYFPAELILRRSCGCFEYRNYFESTVDTNETASLEDKEELLNNYILQAISSSQTLMIKSEGAKILGETLVKAVKTDNVEIFLKEFKIILYTSLDKGYEILEWQRIIRDLLNKLWVLIASPCYASFFTHLAGRIEEIIWEHKMEQLFVHKKQSNELTRTLHIISIELITTFSLTRLKNILDSTLPALGITHFYITRYIKEPDEQKKVQLYIAYNNGNNIDLPPKENTCVDHELLPSAYLDPSERYSF
ncbi:MAG: substrate-binding domain-containing protein, partial [Candidatus Pacearchaeota archaeon]|nr:substrate-binding domain-containing protein [Candidatus Pacearchaeota archaeon]